MDNLNQTLGAGERKQEQTIDLRPTLFIGIGGTGMEVLLRVRRRILNNLWGSRNARTRVESLTEFPIAQFIHFDLDSGAIVEGNQSQAGDLQFEQIKFSEDEKIVERLDFDKYSRDEDSLEKYPHIKEWMPLTPKRIRDSRVDPSIGAGQIRCLSRLYLFDKYAKVRDKIRHKLRNLKAGLSHAQQLNQLGLRMEPSKFRIVVVGSVAGGTGSGAFLDMGLMSRWLAKAEVGHADVELMLFMPTGYTDHNQDRTEANGYAALMELESAMMGNQGYIGRWDAYDQPELPREPYTEVYLVDSGNLAQQHTKNIKDVYHMVADALFEDFAAGDFARRKRSVAVNQSQHKNFLHDALVPKARFPDMMLSYSMRYSAFGQAVLDTRQEARDDEQSHRWAGAMLKAFFGVGSTDHAANRAVDTQRDDFMAAHMALRPLTFGDFPVFSDRGVELKRFTGEFTDYQIVDDLLQDKSGLLLAGIEQRVNARIDAIRNGFDRKEWPTQVREAVKQLERDAVRDQDSTADTTEDRVAKRRAELLEKFKVGVRDQLYAYLDNKQFGGLEFVLSLVEQIKDRLEAPGSGIMPALAVNGERYHEIKEAVRTREYERLLTNLEQTKGGLFGGGEKQAVAVMDHLRTEIANALKFHLRAKAADEAVTLMQDLSNWLGRKTGVDGKGRAVWSGLVGELQAGRQAVLDMLAQLQVANAILQKDLVSEHATLIPLANHTPPPPLPSTEQLRTWADEAFRDLGGSKALFPMLTDSAGHAAILTKVKRMAERQLALTAITEGDTPKVDPLIEALEQLSVNERVDRFRKLLACAMPWIDANLAGDFTVKADQFKCFIGVANADLFASKFKAELDSCVPTQAGITAGQVKVVETGIPGRAVCYCELSGVPLTTLRGMEGWRASYRKQENGKTPTHTHIDPTQFSHPITPGTDELNRLAEHFKNYLLAVMLGVLTRSSQRVVPPGQYEFAVGEGELRRIGNERAIRQDGLPINFRDAILHRVQDQLAALDGTQLVALSVLAGYYEKTVYAARVADTATGSQFDRKGFASSLAGEARRDLREKAHRKGLGDSDIDQLGKRLSEQLKNWCQVVADSDADAYEWEVEPGKHGMPRLKYAFRPEMLTPGRLDALLNGTPVAPAAAGFGAPTMPSLGGIPPLGGLPPPPEHQYHLGVNGQQFGPYTAQQVVQMALANQIAPAQTKVWRQGLAAWIDMPQLPELMQMLPAAAPPLAPPPMMPPPLSQG